MKSKILIVAFLFFGLMAIPFNSVKADDLFKVEITGITNTNEGDNITSTSTFNENVASFSAKLYLPSDKVTFEVSVKNRGSLDAVLSEIVMEQSTNNPVIIFAYQGISEGDVLEVGEETTFEVSVTYNSAVTSQPSEDNLSNSMTITLNYEQYTSSGSDSDADDSGDNNSGIGGIFGSGDTIDIFGVSVPNTVAYASLSVIIIGLLLIIIAIIVTRKLTKNSQKKKENKASANKVNDPKKTNSNIEVLDIDSANNTENKEKNKD